YIRQFMGMCPQFDVVWGKLSCRDHLLFYARLKGVPRHILRQHVADLLEAVNLTVSADVPAGALSGGMRRRLSVAIALCGRPSIVYLDEPTTGLDPASRRSLWNIILSMRKSRAMLLTTHSMEEADALC
ncbi:ABC transporter A, ABCA, partial [Kipferlia bialata]